MPKMNITYFIKNLILNIFMLNNFFGKSSIFWGNYEELFQGAFDHFLGKEDVLLKKLA